MNPWDEFSGEQQPSPIKRQLQGPRPAPLKVNKDSHKIKKPPIHPPPKPPKQPPPAPETRQPVIIYAVSPKVIHTTENEFMGLVQRLTGPSSGEMSGNFSGDISPAARLATIERTSPSGRERGMIDGFEVGNFPGILSPAPASLAPISAGMFSPGFDMSLLNEMSPFLSNMFTPSPSSLLAAPMVSPSPTSFELLSQFFDL
ncbi:hypothetical protein DCAR_0416586 [Daucus carota subsp. sativus]|uniref:Uncharacterized protein n=1 Tax=Daucus carota subsp. sativus TaxID=79200 RepID=A0A165XM53_DAUCS|nr:PREDICTED: protein MKS1-like [Daucus carota subsp. sativus]WOG97246.1 hypothetical protein DCAR_0416586 [Daucus carota subsp. sativus]